MQTREAIASQWLERVLRTYPVETATFLAHERDPFRNPVGHALKRGLQTLLDEVLLTMNAERLSDALESIIQIRAVQDCSPAKALEFLFQLKPILRQFDSAGECDLLCSRVDEVALRAFDIYMKCRERIFQARANEARRRVYVLERRFGECEPAVWQERGAK